jgi:hypothetical protein
MPNGIYPVPQFHAHPRHSAGRRSGLLLRVQRALGRRDRVDDQPARGASPATSAVLRLRDAKLRSGRSDRKEPPAAA